MQVRNDMRVLAEFSYWMNHPFKSSNVVNIPDKAVGDSEVQSVTDTNNALFCHRFVPFVSAECYVPLKGLRTFIFWNTNKSLFFFTAKLDLIRFKNWTDPKATSPKSHVKERFTPVIIGYWPDKSPSIRSNSAPSPSLGREIDFWQWEVIDHISTALIHHAVYSSLYWPTTQKHRHNPHTTSALDLPHRYSLEYFSLLLIDPVMWSW